MAGVRAALNYSSSIANIAREASHNFGPLQQVAQEVDNAFEPVREQIRLNASFAESFREKMVIDQSFFERITPRFEMPSSVIPQFESAIQAMNISVIKEMSESFTLYNKSALNDILTRQLYVNVSTAEVSDDLSEDQVSRWFEIRDKIIGHSQAIIYYSLGISLITYTTIQIIADPTGLEFIAAVSSHYHNQETARRNKDRDTE